MRKQAGLLAMSMMMMAGQSLHGVDRPILVDRTPNHPRRRYSFPNLNANPVQKGNKVEEAQVVITHQGHMFEFRFSIAYGSRKAFFKKLTKAEWEIKRYVENIPVQEIIQEKKYFSYEPLNTTDDGQGILEK